MIELRELVVWLSLERLVLGTALPSVFKPADVIEFNIKHAPIDPFLNPSPEHQPFFHWILYLCKNERSLILR